MDDASTPLPLGATYLGQGRTGFHVWASKHHDVHVLLEGLGKEELVATGRGYFRGIVDDVGPGTRYRYVVGGEEVADPASRSQPDGVHGPSEVVDPAFEWRDGTWHGLPLADYVVYELHVGTFTEGGTFDAAVERLDDLVDLGVTAVEVMPIAEFPGGRNWGYDGVFPFAAQSTYGGLDGFRGFVDACHERGLAVVLDVVYNHFGPEGSVHGDVAEYFTDRYDTPWGPALNFDDAHAGGVRRYFVENALWWTDDCHVDALRLDAVHAIHDRSARHFLDDVAAAVHARADRHNRRVHVIAESDLNDPRLLRPREIGGYGLDAQWTDDFHHALHAALTGESEGYYADFGATSLLAAALRDGFVFTGQWSDYRQRHHGAPPVGIPGQRFVVCTQNHDQVGNRMEGERLSALVDKRTLALAATFVLLSPFVPLLFMGEEYGETAPFLYFVSHTDDDLVAAVRDGRRDEFAAFRWAGEPPDPQAEETFHRSRLDHALKKDGWHAELLAYYRDLIAARREVEPLRNLDRDRIETDADDARRTISWRRWTPQGEHVLVTANVAREQQTITASAPEGTWRRLLASPGADVPYSLDSDGALRVPLPARATATYLLRPTA